MEILVTGATGFIGQHVVPILLNHGHEVTALSRDMDKAKAFEWYDNVKYIGINYHRDNTDYYVYCGKPDALIHLAWQGLSNYNSATHVEDNLLADYKFVSSFIDRKIDKVVVAGTCAEYGMRDGCLSENMCTNPTTYYAIAKDTLRKILEIVIHENDNKTSFNWARLFYMYGKGQYKNAIIPQLDKAIDSNDKVFNMSGGEQLRDYLPVEKVAEYLCLITEQHDVNGTINCCSGQPISIRTLVENHIKKRNSDILLNLGYYPYLDYEPMSFWGNTEKLKRVISALY